ncbi:response regulator [Halobium palmae]|uniref:Response regulator n=1 Tax=Halobium palmae TaxID=1776492 RepID=A0ABD5S2K2_9EURY
MAEAELPFAPHAGAYRVLVVDDDPNIGGMTSQFLEELTDVRSTANEPSVADGLSRLDDEEFDAVVSDYNMPGANGLEFLDEVRARDPDLPFILFTGKGSESIASEAISRGVTDYLQKGSGIEQYDLLANRTLNAIEQARARRELRETVTQFRSLAETFSFALLTVSEDSVVRHATPTVEQVFGYEKRELVGESLLTVMPERFHEDHREAVERYLREGERHLNWGWIELPAVHADGHEIPLGITFGEVERSDDHLFTAMVRDLSEWGIDELSN